MNTYSKVYITYFLLFLMSSYIMTLTFKDHKIPIKNNTSYIRVFNLISLREFILLPPISFMVLWSIKRLFDIEMNYFNTGLESVVYLLITATIIHMIFGVKTMLNYTLGLSMRPDGTGIVPYPNY